MSPMSKDILDKLVFSGVPKTMCNRDDVRQLFRSSEDEEAEYFYDLWKMAIMRDPPHADGTVRSFHSFWDRNIRDILEELIDWGKSIRSDKDETSTASKRPSFGFLMGGVCTFGGEEGSVMFSGHLSKKKLFSNLTWTYDPAPYLLGE
jgi:hypothetical protein